jgi:hypothetical protein
VLKGWFLARFALLGGGIEAAPACCGVAAARPGGLDGVEVLAVTASGWSLGGVLVVPGLPGGC